MAKTHFILYIVFTSLVSSSATFCKNIACIIFSSREMATILMAARRHISISCLSSGKQRDKSFTIPVTHKIIIYLWIINRSLKLTCSGLEHGICCLGHDFKSVLVTFLRTTFCRILTLFWTTQKLNSDKFDYCLEILEKK